MTIYFKDSKVLFNGGSVAMSADCCCVDCTVPCDVVCGNSLTPPVEQIVTISNVSASYECITQSTSPAGDCFVYGWYNMDSLNGTYVFSKKAGNTPYSGAPSGDFCWLEREKTIGSGIYWEVKPVPGGVCTGGTTETINATAKLNLDGSEKSWTNGFPYLATDCTVPINGLGVSLFIRGNNNFSATANPPECWHFSTWNMAEPTSGSPACSFTKDSDTHGQVERPGTDEWCGPAFDYTLVLADATVTLEQGF